MKPRTKKSSLFVGGLAVMLCIALSPLEISAGALLVRGRQAARGGAVPAQHAQAVNAFEERAKAYAKERERLEETLPKLSKESTPEQIQAHKTAFRELVRTSRAGARQGQIFDKGIATYIRATIRREFRGRERAKLRETVMEADTKGVPLRVNLPYPETKELTEIPPTLLLKLPQLPKQLRYRFVGRHMLLMDRENGLIVDYMHNALP